MALFTFTEVTAQQGLWVNSAYNFHGINAERKSTLNPNLPLTACFFSSGQVHIPGEVYTGEDTFLECQSMASLRSIQGQGSHFTVQIISLLRTFLPPLPLIYETKVLDNELPMYGVYGETLTGEPIQEDDTPGQSHLATHFIKY